MGSATEEASLLNAWICVSSDSVKCLSCVKELLNFQWVIPENILTPPMDDTELGT